MSRLLWSNTNGLPFDTEQIVHSKIRMGFVVLYQLQKRGAFSFERNENSCWPFDCRLAVKNEGRWHASSKQAAPSAANNAELHQCSDKSLCRYLLVGFVAELCGLLNDWKSWAIKLLSQRTIAQFGFTSRDWLACRQLLGTMELERHGLQS